MNRMNAAEKEKLLKKRIQAIPPLDEEAMDKAVCRQEELAKVPGSLGKLEDISVRIAGITGKVTGNTVKKQCIAVMSADNGVVKEGVASAPQSVTLSQTINFTRRITGVSSQCRYFGIDLLVTDLGVAMKIPEELYTDSMLTPDNKIPVQIVNRSLANGTKNLAKEPAMTREQAVNAVLVGFEAADAMAEAGIELCGIGEMGIGNTTTSSCLLAALTGVSADRLVGRGGGLNNEGLQKKIKIVSDAGKKCKGMEPIEMLRHIGGFDLCAMAGAYLGAASHRIPAVIDGFISITAACVAQAMNPKVTDYLFASHKSREIGYNTAMERLGLSPMFDLGMRLGEGSGCPIAFKIIEASLATMNLMKTLKEGSIDAEYLEEIKKGNFF